MFLVENVAYEHAPCTHTEHNQCDLAAVFRDHLIMSIYPVAISHKEIL